MKGARREGGKNTGAAGRGRHLRWVFLETHTARTPLARRGRRDKGRRCAEETRGRCRDQPPPETQRRGARGNRGGEGKEGSTLVDDEGRAALPDIISRRRCSASVGRRG